MFPMLKVSVQIVDGMTGRSGLKSPDDDIMPQEKTMKAECTDEGFASALAQIAKGLAEAYAERVRPDRTGRLHRV